MLGIRGYAEAKGARAVMMTEDEVESWLESDDEGESESDDGKEKALALFAYPALDNFSGVLHPLDWAQRLREMNKKKRWFTLLDAAAFCPAHSLDLATSKPDFVSLSFYKIFGLPTGVGALLVRREAFAALSRVYFGGGSTAIETASPGFNVLKCEPVASFEVRESGERFCLFRRCRGSREEEENAELQFYLKKTTSKTNNNKNSTPGRHSALPRHCRASPRL